MANTHLTKDLVDDPSLWRLSMLIGDSAIDVLAHRVVGGTDLVCASLPFDTGTTTAAGAIEEAVYANPLLLAPFGKIDIVVRTSDFFITPPEVAGNNEAMQSLSEIFRGGDSRSVQFLSPVDSRNAVTFFLDKGVANFLGRTYDPTRPQHVLSSLGRYFTYKSRLGNSSKMYVNLTAGHMDLLVFDNLGLAAANSFSCPDINDATYYVIAVARTAGLDPQASEVFLAGDQERRAALTTILRRFFNYVMPAIFPSAAYHGNPAALKAPFPLIILPLCE